MAATSWLLLGSLLLISIYINNGFIVPSSCYQDTSLNGTACCNTLRNQCTFDAETSFNCSYGGSSNSTTTQNLLHLTMSKCGLNGNISEAITNLPFLMRLDLSGNFLIGSIPTNIGDVGRVAGLEYLDLSGNSLEGTIPKSIGYDGLQVSLKYLDISSNNLIRMNWASITELENLEYLDLSDNNIAENFHESIGDLPKLRVLNLGINRISSSIPYQIAGMTQLTTLNLERNDMSGTLPKELSQMNDLQILNISDNKFTGVIPEEWSQEWGVEKLQYLNLGENEFDCPVRDYSVWAQYTDFIESYGDDGNMNCYIEPSDNGSSSGLDGVEVAIIVIAVIVILALGLYCFQAQRQKTIKAEAAMLNDEDVFDD